MPDDEMKSHSMEVLAWLCAGSVFLVVYLTTGIDLPFWFVTAPLFIFILIVLRCFLSKEDPWPERVRQALFFGIWMVMCYFLLIGAATLVLWLLV